MPFNPSLINKTLKKPYKENGDYIETECLWCKFTQEESYKYSLRISKIDGSFHCPICNSNSGTFNELLQSNNKITEEEAQKIIDDYYSVDNYAVEHNLPKSYLKSNLGLLDDDNVIKIPYFDIEKHEVAIRLLNLNGEIKWKLGSKSTLYGLWKLPNFTDNSYIILVKKELPCQILWYNNIQVLGVPEGTKFKAEYTNYLKDFEAIYVLAGNELEDTNFKNDVKELLCSKELYLISKEKVNFNTDSIDSNSLLSVAEKIIPTSIIEDTSNNLCEEIAEHVLISKQILKKYYIFYYHADFYVYENGVYRRNRNLIEKAIIEINPNAKKSLRTEVLEYIRIETTKNDIDVDTRFINFQNGLFDLEEQKLIPHSHDFFVTTQVHAIFIEDKDLVINLYIDKFLDDITCGDSNRKLTLLQYSRLFYDI